MTHSLAQSSVQRTFILAWALPAILGASLYLINLQGTRIYDDVYLTQDDERLKEVHRWRDYLTQTYFPDQVDPLWRPLASITYAIQWKMHGEHAWPFHLVNLLLHAGVCGVVGALGVRLTGSSSIGLIAGLLFAAHPIHVDAVSCIVGRTELMCALGVVGAMLLVIHRRMSLSRALAVLGCFVFAALSKEQGLLLPLMLLGWVATQGWMRRKNATVFETPIRDAREKTAIRTLIAFLTITLAAYIAYRDTFAKWYWEHGFMDWVHNPIMLSVGRDRWLIPVAILGRYSVLLLCPWKLAVDYSAMVFTPVQSLSDPYLWAGFVTLIGAAAIAWFAVRRRNVAVMYCLLAFAISYFLASNIVLIGTVFGERLMYLPSVFACVLAAMALDKLRTKKSVMSIVLLLMCLRTETYAWQWNDRLRFYRYLTRVQPRSVKGYVLLADELQKRHRMDEVAGVLAKGREVCPDAHLILSMSARYAMEHGDFVHAMLWANRDLKLRPGADTAGMIGEIGERMHPAKSSATQPTH